MSIARRKEKKPVQVNRRAVADINLPHLLRNYRTVRSLVGNRKIIASVKADAYGHGAEEAARALEGAGADAFGVAFLSEGIALRKAGIKSPVIVFFDNERAEPYFEHALTPVIFEEGMAAALSRQARETGKPIDVHVKIDTGMGRVGIVPERAVPAVREMSRMEGIRVRGIMSHFSEADLADRSFAEKQLGLFVGISNELKGAGLDLISHIANSAAVLSMPDSHLDAVRPGLMLYGYSPFGPDSRLMPVMEVRASLISLRRLPEGTPISYGRTFVTRRRSLIGVVPIGYADGYCRAFSNNAEVIVRGRRVPVVGRVCMDLCMVDVTDVEGVQRGDEATVLARDHGSGLTALGLSARAGTIPYEILTGLGSRSRRVYTGS